MDDDHQDAPGDGDTDDELAPRQRHDRLFKVGFGEPRRAADFLREHLPADLSKAVDWDSLRREPDSFVDSHFRSSESDLLFSAEIGGREARLYLELRRNKLNSLLVFLTVTGVGIRHD